MGLRVLLTLVTMAMILDQAFEGTSDDATATVATAVGRKQKREDEMCSITHNSSVVVSRLSINDSLFQATVRVPRDSASKGKQCDVNKAGTLSTAILNNQEIILRSSVVSPSYDAAENVDVFVVDFYVSVLELIKPNTTAKFDDHIVSFTYRPYYLSAGCNPASRKLCSAEVTLLLPDQPPELSTPDSSTAKNESRTTQAPTVEPQTTDPESIIIIIVCWLFVMASIFLALFYNFCYRRRHSNNPSIRFVVNKQYVQAPSADKMEAVVAAEGQ